MDYAGEDGEGVVLWIHATQEIELEPIREFFAPTRALARRIVFWNVHEQPDSNVVAKRLREMGIAQPLAITGDFAADLAAYIESWGESATRYVPTRQSVSSATWKLDPAVTVEASGHLQRLWIQDEVERLLSASSLKNREAAMALASKHALVTTRTGAVVLESSAQYEEADLQPEDPRERP